MFTAFVRLMLHIFLTRPFMYVWVGFNVKHEECLPRTGPAILVCNHNSHLDTLALETLLPLRLLHKLRPVAAADYFLSNRFLMFLSRMMNIIPVERTGSKCECDPLAACHEALRRGEILIIYPEGSRGEPERMERFKSGIAWLATQHSNIPVYPICLRGLGKVLPKGSIIPVPFFCDVGVGRPIYSIGDRHEFLKRLESDMDSLAQEIGVKPWI